jgi:KDO2-lipid IV(A) lauroyltransferase
VFNYILYRIGRFLALRLPLKLCYGIAIIISDVRAVFAPQDRRQVEGNFKAIFPEKPEREIRRIRIRMFRNFAKYLVDFFRFSIIDKDYIKQHIQLQNLDYFDQVLREGKGAITLTAHLGNWELGGIVIALLGYPFWAVALVHKDKRVNDFFNAQRENKGMKVIPFGRAVIQCLRVLAKNEIVALVGDRDFTGKGIVIDFFGKPTFLPVGPAAFAQKTKAWIIPGFMVRNQDDTFTVRIERPIEPSCEPNEKDGILALVEQYKVIIEDYIRKYPDQWYMFRKFWIDSK